MKNQCIGCKREISRQQKNCYVCGSSQNYIRYHIKSLILIAVLLIGQTAYGYWYLGEVSEQNKLKIATIIETQTNQIDSKIEQMKILLQQANDEVDRYKSNSTQAEESVAQEKLKFNSIEKRAVDAESRARWLSTENRRFQAKIKSLSDELSSIRATISANNSLEQITPNLTEQEQEQEQINLDGQH